MTTSAARTHLCKRCCAARQNLLVQRLHETGCHARTIMSLKLYWMPISQPARCVAWALEYAGVEYESVNVMPGAHDVLLRPRRALRLLHLSQQPLAAALSMAA